VLSTPQQANNFALDNRGFFHPAFVYGRVAGNNTIPVRTGKVTSRFAAVFKYLTASLNRNRNLNIAARKPVMASQSDGVITPIVFSFNSLSIRAETDEHGNTRFIASNVCKILGYINCRQSINAYRREDGVSKRYTIDRIGRRQETIAINEVNLYRLIIQFKKPEEEKFERLAMEEIPPAFAKQEAIM
jgi:hypothetical protein